MDEVRATLVALLKRVSTPLSAALIFCAIGLTCAVGVISINRLLAMRPPPVAAALPSPPGASSPAPSSAAATPTPTSAAAASCAIAPAPKGNLGGLVVTTDATVLLATDNSTTAVMVLPSGAQVDGHAGDVHAQLTGVAGQAQPVSGTVVRDISICASGSAGVVRIGITAGTSVSGSAVASAGGIEAADVRFSGAGGGGGGGGGD
jgi:hypothetical protein